MQEGSVKKESTPSDEEGSIKKARRQKMEKSVTK